MLPVTNDEAPRGAAGVPRRSIVFGIPAAGLLAAALSQIELSRADASTGPWGGYSNGRIPESALTAVDYPGVKQNQYDGAQERVRLKPDAARALLDLLGLYHAQFGNYLPVIEGYRSYAGQEYWDDYYNHNRKYAAQPGFSNHGWGEAVDFGTLNSQQLSWVRSNSGHFGYTSIESENWHFNYSGNYIPIHPNEEDDMEMYITRNQTGTVAVFGGGFKAADGSSPGRHEFASLDEYKLWRIVLNAYNVQIDRLGLDARGKHFVPPENASNVVGVDENTWATICHLYGV